MVRQLTTGKMPVLRCVLGGSVWEKGEGGLRVAAGGGVPGGKWIAPCRLAAGGPRPGG